MGSVFPQRLQTTGLSTLQVRREEECERKENGPLPSREPTWHGSTSPGRLARGEGDSQAFSQTSDPVIPERAKVGPPAPGKGGAVGSGRLPRPRGAGPDPITTRTRERSACSFSERPTPRAGGFAVREAVGGE